MQQDLRAAWEINRANNCKPLEAGRKLRKYGPRVELASYRDEQRYADFYHEGRVLSVPNFLREKGYDPAEIGNAAQQKQFVEQALHMMQILIS